MNKDTKYWVALSTHPNIGAKSFFKLLNIFQTMEEVWKTSKNELLKKRIDEKIANAVVDTRQSKNPDKEIEKVKKLGIKVITINDEDYPQVLKEITDRPALLYIKGEISDQDSVSVAVVGARKYTPYGLQVTEEIVMGLASNGITITSGLALGIDAIAHQSALETKRGRTIGVLGCGLDQIYPTSNKHLADRIINEKRGALISEFPLGMPALKHNFPYRNRIIAGLCLGTIVVEGALKSGSLITARCALDYNREVFAVPGSIYNEMSKGPNHLIKMGAKMVLVYDDVLDELNIETRSKEQRAQKTIADTLEESLILNILKTDNPIHIDKLTKDVKLDINKVNSTLVMMEIKGKVKNLGGNLYIRK